MLIHFLNTKHLTKAKFYVKVNFTHLSLFFFFMRRTKNSSIWKCKWFFKTNLHWNTASSQQSWLSGPEKRSYILTIWHNFFSRLTSIEVHLYCKRNLCKNLVVKNFYLSRRLNIRVSDKLWLKRTRQGQFDSVNIRIIWSFL